MKSLFLCTTLVLSVVASSLVFYVQTIQPINVIGRGHQLNISNQSTAFVIFNTTINNENFNLSNTDNAANTSAILAITTMLPQLKKNIGLALQTKIGNQNVTLG